MENLSQIILRLKKRISELDKNDENYTVESRELLEELTYFKNCFLIGLYKKIDQMEREELLKIAFANMDKDILSINVDKFMKEYEDAKAYIDGFTEDVKKKREIITTFDFIVEGRMCALFNEDGTPKINIIVSFEEQELVIKQYKIKSYPIHSFKKISARVSQDFFSTEELYRLGLHKLSSCDDYLPGSTYRHPNDANIRKNDLYKPYPNVFVTLSLTKDDSKKLTSEYDYYEALKIGKKLENMGELYSKVKMKSKLESDLEYLRKYIKSLVFEQDFIREFNRNATMQIHGITTSMHEMYETSVIDFLEDYDITEYINAKINSI